MNEGAVRKFDLSINQSTHQLGDIAETEINRGSEIPN
jgi:hypothetical protein